jgi:hypothetical protein
MLDDVGAAHLVSPVCTEFENFCRQWAGLDCQEVLVMSSGADAAPKAVRSADMIAAAIQEMVRRVDHVVNDLCCSVYGAYSPRTAQQPSETAARLRALAAIHAYDAGLGDCVDLWRLVLQVDAVLQFWLAAVDIIDSSDATVFMLLLGICARSAELFDLFEDVFEQSVTLYLSATASAARSRHPQQLFPASQCCVEQLVMSVCEKNESFLKDKVGSVEVQRRLSRTCLSALQKFVAQHDDLLVFGLSRELLEMLKQAPSALSKEEDVPRAEHQELLNGPLSARHQAKVDALATTMTLLPSKDSLAECCRAFLGRHLLSVLFDNSALAGECFDAQQLYSNILQRIGLKVGSQFVRPLMSLIQEVHDRNWRITCCSGEPSAQHAVVVPSKTAAENGCGRDGERGDQIVAQESSVTLLTASRWRSFALEPLLWNSAMLITATRVLLPVLGSTAVLFERTLAATPGGARRRLDWPACMGSVHAVAQCGSHGSLGPLGLLQLRVSPIVALVLAAVWHLDDYSLSDRRSSISCHTICNLLRESSGCEVPKELVSAILRQAVAAGALAVNSPGDDFRVPPPTNRPRKIRLQTPQHVVSNPLEPPRILKDSTNWHADPFAYLRDRTSGVVTDDNSSVGLIASRKKKLEAAIARIIKRHKTLSHDSLLSASVAEMERQFPVTPAMFKECLGMLLEKEYVVRDDAVPDTYTFIS